MEASFITYFAAAAVRDTACHTRTLAFDILFLYFTFVGASQLHSLTAFANCNFSLALLFPNRGFARALVCARAAVNLTTRIVVHILDSAG